jgi:hypothetical protein
MDSAGLDVLPLAGSTRMAFKSQGSLVVDQSIYQVI